nr:MAG TPA: hypothetical protein [Caudoviricetes sp.]DAW46666.1 MAG TPA: hypothetical protein [Caudoviricetes sp.]
MLYAGRSQTLQPPALTRAAVSITPVRHAIQGEYKQNSYKWQLLKI